MLPRTAFSRTVSPGAPAPGAVRRSVATRRSGTVPFLGAVAALGLCLLVVPPSAVHADEPSEMLPTVSAERGLPRVEGERRPALVIVVPVEGREEYLETFWGRVRGSTRKRLEREFVLVEVRFDAEGRWPAAEPAGPDEDPVPWDSARARRFLEGRLGPLGPTAVVAIVDFTGKLLARHDEDPPAESSLRKVVRAALSANEEKKKVYARAEKGVEQFGLALKKKQYADACRLFLALQELDLPLDSPVVKEREEHRATLEKAFDARVAEAKELEEDDQLAQAVAEYEKILVAFPLPEWQDEMRTRIGVLWRKIYGRNPPVGGGGR